MKRCTLDWVACGCCRHPEIMTKKQGSLCPADFPSHVGIIRHPDAGVILFDTGYDTAFLSATSPFPERFYRWTTPVTLGENIVETLKQHEISTEQVNAIIISHLHGDHVAGLHHFPNAKIFCSEAGIQTLRKNGRFARVRQGILSALIPHNIEQRAKYFEQVPSIHLSAIFAPFERAVDLLGDASLLAVELPGHSAGHWGLLLRSESDHYIFLVADAAWSIASIEHYIPPPRITTALLGNTNHYRKTLNSLHLLHKRNPDIIMLPSHCADAAKKLAGSTR